MKTLLSLLLILFSSTVAAQSPIALSTSDPKFAPHSEIIPKPIAALAFGTRGPGYANGSRPAGRFDVAYALVDEQSKLSPLSKPVTIASSSSDWDIVVSTPVLDLWTRAIGTMWVYRATGTAEWKSLGCNRNCVVPWAATRPFMPLVGWDHSLGGFQLFSTQNFWPTFSDVYWKQTSTLAQPPPPSVRLLSCPNIALEAAYSWACNEGETPLSDVTSIAAVPGNPATIHAPCQLYRNIIPPQGALGSYVYLRVPGGQWHRQKSHQSADSYLWPIDSNQLPINEYVETGVKPSGIVGKSWLSSIHLAMRDWRRDVIIDTDQTICCPVISAYDGPSWVYDPRNQQIAFGVNAFAYPNEGWTLSIDGVTSGYLRPTSGWQTWQQVADTAFGPGNVELRYGSGFGGVVIVFTGKYAATDMTNRIKTDFTKLYQINNNDASKPLMDTSVPPKPIPFAVPIVDSYTQSARSWYMSAGGQKFNRTIATGNGGGWVLSDTATTPEGKSSYPGDWPLWVENSQRTRLIGCKMTRNQSNCGIAFIDHSGGGAFSFTAKDCACSAGVGNNGNTYGVRCTWTSRGPAWNNHSASEPYFENCSFQAKHCIVCEGGQSVNWLFNTTYGAGDGTIESSIVTQANSGAMSFKGRTNVDNSRTIGAMTWAGKVDIEGIWLDQGVPCWFTITGNTFPAMSINGTKINQWRDWLHVIEAPTGSIGYPVNLTLSNLDSQFNGQPVTMLASTRDMLTVTQKDPVNLLANLVKTGLVTIPVPVKKQMLRSR